MDQYVCTECGGTIIHDDKVCPHCGSDTSEIIDCPQDRPKDDKSSWTLVLALAGAGVVTGLIVLPLLLLMEHVDVIPDWLVTPIAIGIVGLFLYVLKRFYIVLQRSRSV